MKFRCGNWNVFVAVITAICIVTAMCLPALASSAEPTAWLIDEKPSFYNADVRVINNVMTAADKDGELLNYNYPIYDKSLLWSGVASETAPSQNSEGYYEIGSGEELAWFSNYVNSTDRMANAILTKDIYLNYGGEYTNNWFNFKMGTNEANAFKGTFDGNGHAIIGLYSAGNNYDHGGLFNVLDNATVKNLNIREAKIVGGRDTENQETFIGIIAGYSKASNIENCTVTGTVTEAEGKNIKLCGGIVANLSGGSIRECTADVDINIGSTVTSDEYVNTGVGGIAGRFAYGATVERCGFEGTIEAPNRLHVGGIAGGCNRNDVTVKEVYNRGNITGGSKVAGIIGNSYNCKVYSAYNTGNIAAVAENGIAGGLIGVGTLSNTSGAKGYYTTGTVTGDAAYSGLAFTDASATETKFNSFIYPEFTEGITHPIGRSPDAELGARMPLNDIASEKALTKLNEWAPDTYKIIPGFNNGYPVFMWQTRNGINDYVLPHETTEYYLYVSIDKLKSGELKLNVNPYGQTANIEVYELTGDFPAYQEEITQLPAHGNTALDSVSVSAAGNVILSIGTAKDIVIKVDKVIGINELKQLSEEPLDELGSDAGDITASMYYEAKGSDKKATMIAALYDGEELIECRTGNTVSLTETPEYIYVDIDLTGKLQKGYTLRAFLWADTNSIIPLTAESEIVVK